MTSTSLTGTGSGFDRFRYGKAYTVRQVGRLAGVSPATVRRWLEGYEAPGHQMAPVFGGVRESNDAPGISFLQLIEIVVVARFRRGKRPIQLDRLRRAHALARERFGLQYPFASLSLREFGGHVLHEFDVTDADGPALALDIGGQWAIPGFVTQVLNRMDFSEADRLAERWFPAGRSAPIVLDPRIGAGRLTVLGSGVTVDTIHQRFLAGESIELLADDYELDEATIQEAIRFADRGDLAVA
jgi:uncharacterized protein (DUF433 family)